MGLWSEEIFEIVCDGDGCTETSTIGDYATSAAAAERQARDCGFVERDGKWLCESCAKETEE